MRAMIQPSSPRSWVIVRCRDSRATVGIPEPYRRHKHQATVRKPLRVVLDPSAATVLGASSRLKTARRSLPLLESHVLPLALAVVDLPRARDRLLVVLNELEPLRDPARGARDGEDHREHLGRHAERLVDQARVVVDVRVELPLGEELVVEGVLLELDRDLELRALAGDLEHLVDVPLDDP